MAACAQLSTLGNQLIHKLDDVLELDFSTGTTNVGATGIKKTDQYGRKNGAGVGEARFCIKFTSTRFASSSFSTIWVWRSVGEDGQTFNPLGVLQSSCCFSLWFRFVFSIDGLLCENFHFFASTELDVLPCCKDSHKWTWFRRYCLAARVADSLIARKPLPLTFCQEVQKKIQQMLPDGERVGNEHENNQMFKKEHDEQLLLWLNRYDLTLWKP